MKVVLSGLKGGALYAVLLREMHGALVNRYFQVFSALALSGGIATAALSEATNAAVYFILQIALYFVSLFALLVGVSSARAEHEEWPILFAQPVPRTAYVFGKFAALWVIFGGVLALLFIPALFSDSSTSALLHLYGNTLGLAAIFGSAGLCTGILARDRAQALVLGVSVWLFLLFGLDLIALFTAQWAVLQSLPDLWVSLLMVNPLDAFRIQALFALEQIPVETASKTPLAAWWIYHASAWFAFIALAWSTMLLFIAARRLERAEI